MAQLLPFTGPWLLAPMEGITEPCFRSLVLGRNPPDRLGGAFTEFVRVTRLPVPERILQRHLGEMRHRAPVGLQLMGADGAALAETTRRAEKLGAPVIDLNFGCPAKGALRGRAGAALLGDPPAIERLVRSCADAVSHAPVTAKIRAGCEDDSRLEDLARAAEAGGAALLTVHCRTRAEGFGPGADWERIARAVRAVAIPVCGNGGVEHHGDLEAMRERTGCRYVMVGRAALADPWIFSGIAARADDAAGFLLEYADRLEVDEGFSRPAAVGRVKQLLRLWTAGGLCEPDRLLWLRELDPDRLLARLRSLRAPLPS